ncbi:hypothetical protein SCHPADRAFT_35220 [Schizopora paradoxa]|uniref:Ricin B lectin domain-containing protein n=1 Tax=Schizopora paradoxa TaxID=27342 RepID=A0A0H2S7I3_9AGAM|nr:hypothetical protein SCHPADRAFT_35220 [Schizopora paradoxa]
MEFANKVSGSMFGAIVDLARQDVKKLDEDYPDRKRPRDGALYKIVNIGRKRYFNLGNCDTKDGAPVIGWPIDGRQPATNEKWKFTDKGGKCTLQCLLTLQQRGQKGGYAKVLQRSAGTKATHGSTTFEWVLEETRDKVFFIKPAGAEHLCLTAASDQANTWQLAQLTLANQNEAARQKQEWIFVECSA